MIPIDDYDDKLTYIYCFLHEKYFLDKNPQKRTLWYDRLWDCALELKKLDGPA